MTSNMASVMRMRSTRTHVNVILSCAGAALVFSVGLCGCKKSPHAAARKNFDEGRRLYLAGQSEEAVAFFSKAICLDPSCADAYSYRGDICFRRGDYDLAVADHTQVVLLLPSDGFGYYSRGLALLEQGKYQRATDDFSEAIDLGMKDPSAYARRGFAFFRLGMYTEAIADIDTYLQSEPVDAEAAYHTRGAAYASKGNGPAAIRDFTRAIEIDPAYARAYFGRAVAYLDSGRWSLAQADLEEALKLGLPDEVLDEARSALQLARDHVETGAGSNDTIDAPPTSP